MIQILNVIILACQVNSGTRNTDYLLKTQAKCHKELIKCVGLPDIMSSKQEEQLVKCLAKRGE